MQVTHLFMASFLPTQRFLKHLSFDDCHIACWQFVVRYFLCCFLETQENAAGFHVCDECTAAYNSLVGLNAEKT